MSDLFDDVRELDVKFAASPRVLGSIHGASVVARGTASEVQRLKIRAFKQRSLLGVLGTSEDGADFLFLPRKTTASLPSDNVFLCPTATDVDTFSKRDIFSEPRMLSPKPLDPKTDQNAISELKTRISESWKDGLSLDEEKVEDGKVTRSGFRPPQVGALHALKAHWTVSSKVATVVMPTGTGKTETMIAAMYMEQAKCVLVVVPSDALRSQIGQEFSNLGMLPTANLIGEAAQKPIVTLLRKRPKTIDEAAAIFRMSNVVVTTMSIAAGVSPEIRKTMASFTSHLFIDEAHHVAAKTWREFRQNFDEVKTVQFTATPFRNDGMRVDGKFVFVYPLTLAQNQGYFRKINFEPIEGLDRTEIDDRIIDKIGECLNRDEEQGFRHLAMARGSKRARAEELFQRYRRKLPQYNPVLLHSGLSDGEQSEALKGLRQGTHRIVVCVDMLGEGFDLPELKIAGLHDPKKSEAVTLQFVGRFIRSRDDLGHATVVAAVTKNDATPLASLFAEDADWNKLINLIGTRATERAVRREEVFEGFEGIDADVPLETLRPTLGTVVYKTSDRPWDPVNGIEDFDRRHNIVDGPHINHHDALAIFITARNDQPKWSRFKGIFDTVYDLYLAHWDQDAQLLFISATSDDRLDDLAKNLCGDDAERVRGEIVFRALNPLRRPVLNTLGLSETRRRKIRYSQYQGSDIADELRTQSGNRTRSKTNLMVVGFSDDGKVSLGCSRKGKIWTQERTNDFGRWMDWCHGLGASLTDETISTSGIIERLIQPELVTEIPNKPVVGIDWYESMSVIDEDSWNFTIKGQQASIYNCELELTTHETHNGIFFALNAGEEVAKFKMTINESGVAFECLDPQSSLAEKNTAPVVIERWFHEYPPTLFFADGDSLVADEFFALPDSEVPYFPEDHFEIWNWDQTNIRVESLGVGQRQDSVQARVVEEISSSTGCHIIFDDDGAGEIADVVAFELDGDHATVRFYHCKYSSSSNPGARVADLYEVCGQAQRSVRRCERPQRILDRMLKREAGRIRNGGPSRFLKGSVDDLRQLISRRHQLDYQFEIYVVQPGYSFAERNSTHSQVLASTESFVIDTYARKFRVICNA
ncbi:DEAD/DEAH box helicase [Yoonia vestfoldensis]|uniref:Excinuclease ABC subunit B n=1 Tax=Yoonia vestfoldensis TaxID=245188 RepID=A0A1Y0EIA4_9RHOB|nr:DEAD/DEAH box helicase family protein [Yoonia vestfoldensis]ARU03198.1 excinuclease ABC subunit B [Yoonia vestfoldensis]